MLGHSSSTAGDCRIYKVKSRPGGSFEDSLPGEVLRECSIPELLQRPSSSMPVNVMARAPGRLGVSHRGASALIAR
jgi:hypothetical protein